MVILFVNLKFKCPFCQKKYHVFVIFNFRTFEGPAQVIYIDDKAIHLSQLRKILDYFPLLTIYWSRDFKSLEEKKLFLMTD